VSLRTEFEPFFLGVDGGGTSCRARLCDMAGVELGVGVAGSANTTLGVDAAFHEIVKAIKMAVLDAGLTDQCFGSIYAGLGLAGLSLRRDYEAVNSYHHPFAELSAETDAYIACLGAHQGQDGGVLIIGTGSCGLLIMGNRSVAVGGWGYLMSDLGSGAQLGRSALRGALEEYDALLPKSGLGTALMAHFDENPETLVTWSETAKPKSYGSFVPEIISHAINKNEAAIALVNSTANDIERMILTLVSKGAAKIALIGGLAEPMLPWLSETVLGYLTKAKGDPLDGALMLARRKYKLVVNDG
jgi:glucosamine kinase